MLSSMHYLFHLKALFFSLLICCFIASPFLATAQTISPDNRIVVLGEARMELLADQAIFKVELEASHPSDVNVVYQQHKELEAKLVQLLKDLKIPPKNISYTLMSVSKEQDYETREWAISSSQRISFHIDSLTQYTFIQTRLIQAGFSGISSELTSSKQNTLEKPLLEQAVKAATEKATILATAAGRHIKRVVKIADTEEEDPVFDYRSYRMPSPVLHARAKLQNADLIDFLQTLPVVVRVKVVFELK